MNPMKSVLSISIAALGWSLAGAQVYSVRKVAADLSKTPKVDAEYWKDVPESTVNLMAQMIVVPKPAKAETEKVRVQIVHDGKYVSFRLRWADKEVSEAGRLAEYSDAVALEFPVLDNAVPPSIFMGSAKNPVHLFHWRAQYQHDAEVGKKTVKEIYPNMHSDIYPNEFPDRGRLKPATEQELELFSPAVVAGNPQASRKKAVDELMAEGFGTSAVTAGGNSIGHGEWKNGEWVVVISRALKCPGGSEIAEGGSSAFGVAVWQGGAEEVGSRKAMTMAWTTFKIEHK
jgi:Ethylbenzene dehydrogenase